MKKILITRLRVCSLGVSCNEMIDTPILLVVHWNGIQKTFLLSYYTSKSEQADNSLALPTFNVSPKY